MTSFTIQRVELHHSRISPKTVWQFVRVQTTDGIIADGEATLGGQNNQVAQVAERFVPQLLTAPTIDEPSSFARGNPPQNITEAAIVSAIDQALWSIQAQLEGQSLAEYIGTDRETVPLYANINRRTVSRTPEAFAQSAADAMAAGHTAFKIAPFDEVTSDVCRQGDGVQAMHAGFARVAAVRHQVGPDARLMIDCHWRFDTDTAVHMIETAAEHGVHWVETPLIETEDHIPALKKLRSRCHSLDMVLAGLETSVRWEGFRPFCEGGAYDVIMPDIKYVGGIHEFQSIAARCEQLGLLVSPHNPSGPICHAASLQLSATLPGFDRLECQFDESPMFDALVTASFPKVRNGATSIPRGIGFGTTLDAKQLKTSADSPIRSWS
ncbi:MAG: mandelate racemase/muconate lactonizing enzyme family protein [Pseudomonadota bacterium]